MYIENFVVRNFRCFDHAGLKLQHPAPLNGKVIKEKLRFPNVTVLLGNNGSGKSSVLKILTIGALGAVIELIGLRPYYLVRRTTSSVTHAHLNVTILLEDNRAERGSLSSRVDIIPNGSYEKFDAVFPTKLGEAEDLEDTSPNRFLVGYGAGRKVQAGEFNPAERDRNRALRYQRVAGLFEDHYDLVPPYAWLNQVRRTGRLEEALIILHRLLPAGIEVETESDDAPLFRRNGSVPLPYLTLSDGFRGYIGWVLDLLYHMDRVTPKDRKLSDLTGVVLVDEIDLFLHPEWQRLVVPTVANALPNLQFVFTTHSPIVAGTVESANVYVCEWDDESGSATLRQPDESIFGLSADQILTSRYFGLTTTRAPGAESELDSIAERAMKGDREAGYEYLQRLTQGFEETQAR
jgi:energy-coupling factor transporter ATP-binding protein EcfA2